MAATPEGGDRGMPGSGSRSPEAPGSPTRVLGDEIEARLAEFTRKRFRDKRKAFWLKIGAAALGALVTVLLGLKAGELEVTFKNIALIAGALVAVLNAWDAFYDHRTLWVKRTATVARLKKLSRSFRMACAAQPELDVATLEGFRVALDQVLDDDLAIWVQMRNEVTDKTSVASAPAATTGRQDA